MSGLSPDQSQDGDARPHLVIVDDDPELPRLLSLILGRTCEIIVAPDGDTALRLITTRGPDLVISDLEMPGMRGDELLRRARAIDPLIASIILSGHSEEWCRGVGGPGSPDAMIQKPFDVRHLQDVVEEVLRQRNLALQSEVTSPPAPR